MRGGRVRKLGTLTLHSESSDPGLVFLLNFFFSKHLSPSIAVGQSLVYYVLWALSFHLPSVTTGQVLRIGD